jgi:hypothetical protein
MSKVIVLLLRDTVITPTLNNPTVITPTLITPTIITPTVTDSLCNSSAFRNPNAVRDCPPFNLKGAWFLSRPRIFAILNFEENMTGIEETN